VITYANGDNIDLPNVTFHRVSRAFHMHNSQKVGPGIAKTCSDLAILKLALKLLRQEPHDLIIGTDIEGAVIAALLKKRFCLPTVIDIHGIFTELLQDNAPKMRMFLGNIPLWVEKWAWQKADLLVCNWLRVERYAKEKVPNIPACTIFDVPQESVHKVACKPFPASNEGRKWQRYLFNKKVVFYAGNFAPYQNFSLALHGFKHALDRGLSDAILFVVGADYGSYLKEATALGINDKVLFIGKRTPEITIDLMRLADICLTLIPNGCNTPSKIIYYFLAGRPILACDSPAHNELLIDGDNALLCSNHHIDFSEKLSYLLKNDETRRQLARASTKYSGFFTLHSHINRWREVLLTFEPFSRQHSQ